jgi:hypothetical protein
MKVYWDAIRQSIESQPLTAELVAVHVGDEVQTRYGRFVVDAVVAVAGPTGTTPPTSSRRHSPRDHNLYRGRLVDWVLGGRAATATLRIKDLKKDLKVRSLARLDRRFLLVVAPLTDTFPLVWRGSVPSSSVGVCVSR